MGVRRERDGRAKTWLRFPHQRLEPKIRLLRLMAVNSGRRDGSVSRRHSSDGSTIQKSGYRYRCAFRAHRLDDRARIANGF
jgi:hypothetical protein